MTVPCAHCGLPAPEPKNEGELPFCCPGCQAVYYALQNSGLDNFYSIRERISPGKAQPAPQNAAANAERFGLESFIEEQTTLNDNGTRSCELHLDGVHCAGCVWLVEKMPSVVEGVSYSSLNLARGRLKVSWDPNIVSLADIARWLGQFGYTAVPLDASKTNLLADAEKQLLYRMGVAWAVAANVMMLAATLYSGLSKNDGVMFHAFRVLSGLLTIISIVYCAPVFFRRAWASIKPWAGWTKLSIDVPISIGIIVGFTQSTIAAITGLGDIWFDSVSVLIAALLTARWLQTRGRRLAGDAAERLITVMPVTGSRLNDDGSTTEVHAEKLAVGDIVLVKMGETVPSDGIIIEGKSTLERAVITGESRPEPVDVGDAVNASEVNVGQPLKIRVTATGANTRVGKLLSWIQESSGRRAEVVHLADAISGYFVGGILFAAVITGFVWFSLSGVVNDALQHVVALLVVSCPCALGMATPLAMTMGMGRASKEGIFIKHEDVVELIRRADVLILDKTGTVTYGMMSIDAATLDSNILADIAAIERISNHPIANAFSNYDDGRKVESCEEIAGFGVAGTVSGHKYKIGTVRWIDVPDAELSEITERGMTPIAIEQDGNYVGVVGVGDEIRKEGPLVVQKLLNRGVAIRLLSGDHPTLVKNAENALGLNEQPPLKVENPILNEVALGAQTPDQKLEMVKQYQAAGLTVVMVGDGVNDAGALKIADVGIAVEGGSDINQIAGDIFLTRAGLYPIFDLWCGCDQVMHIVKRNLVGSLLYNLIGITAAALGFVSPLVAAVAMPISSLSVVASSMIGGRWRFSKEEEDEGKKEQQ